MCDPTTLLAMQGAGAGYSAMGSYFASKAQKAALQGEAAIDEINAGLADLSAKSATLAGQKREQASRLQTASVKGSQRAALAANGVDLGEGSARNILTSTDVVGEIDANTIAAEAVSQAWGYKVQATSLRNDALLKNASAKGISPLASAATSLLGSASQIATNAYLMQKYGALNTGKKPVVDKPTTGGVTSGAYAFTG